MNDADKLAIAELRAERMKLYIVQEEAWKVYREAVQKQRALDRAIAMLLQLEEVTPG